MLLAHLLKVLVLLQLLGAHVALTLAVVSTVDVHAVLIELDLPIGVAVSTLSRLQLRLSNVQTGDVALALVLVGGLGLHVQLVDVQVLGVDGRDLGVVLGRVVVLSVRRLGLVDLHAAAHLRLIDVQVRLVPFQARVGLVVRARVGRLAACHAVAGVRACAAVAGFAGVQLGVELDDLFLRHAAGGHARAIGAIVAVGESWTGQVGDGAVGWAFVCG